MHSCLIRRPWLYGQHLFLHRFVHSFGGLRQLHLIADLLANMDQHCGIFSKTGSAEFRLSLQRLASGSLVQPHDLGYHLCVGVLVDKRNLCG